jgi:hypothetical protein
MSVTSAPIFVPSALRYLHSWNASARKKKLFFCLCLKNVLFLLLKKVFFCLPLNSRLFLFCLFFQLTTSVDRRFLPYLSLRRLWLILAEVIV